MRDNLDGVIAAFHDQTAIVDPIHSFYRYPARFSPTFATAAIRAFSIPGSTVLDPFMGGGTSVVEATKLGRRAIGTDINALSVFLARLKTTPLTHGQIDVLVFWADGIVPALRFTDSLETEEQPDSRVKNLQLPQAKFIKKLMALAMDSLRCLPDSTTRQFARGALLNAGQWAIDGRRNVVHTKVFRDRVQTSMHRMLDGMRDFSTSYRKLGHYKPVIFRCAAENLGASEELTECDKADLVVTSPPYPGVHILYHRWQVNGRRETPAPYWITNTSDGKGSAYYNLGDRKNRGADDYFARLEQSFAAIRSVMKEGATLVQMVSFAEPERDLPRYVAALSACGLQEFSPRSRTQTSPRLWRSVPRRAWHAAMKGSTTASREVLLIHRAT